ncbi:Efflux pump periplasmic linker BepF [Aquisphaera giovannonii]|uniref:Efflux pump periplasmic linker BepF n=1 Tax=Aquisphaera giovannonii TaxID=406548 RepID=A0A5B9VWM1_9BACT|nr:M56 family metallopeptidase [Aquisphaera giovannonii]QEH32632.1 Efflux pump periplasmic linker BepF [Aquisphaera giovannonii]
MDGLLIEALTNSAWAAAMALLAVIAVRLARPRPEVVHLLWVLVLLKLVTPSLIRHQAATPAGPSEQAGHQPLVAEEANPALPLTKGELEGVSGAGLGDRIHPPVSPPRKGGSESRPVPSVIREPSAGWPWRTILAATWMAGALAWALAIVIHASRVRRLLRIANPASGELTRRIETLAARMGLRRAPAARLVPAPIPPMLWALVGPPRLLLPEGLWEGLDEAQRDTVLVHELAHLRRRDHWVRRLEAVVLGLHWWNPVAWWARRRVEDAEEQCCDAVVARTLPESVESYAEALVTTAAFLSGVRAPRPFGASGVGRVPPLRRRLDMILRDETPAKSRPVPAAAMLVAGLSLLLLPGWAPARARQATPPATNDRDATQPQPPAPSPAVRDAEPGKDAAPPRVRVSQPIVRDIRDGINFVGVVEAARSVELRPQVAGTLTEVRVKSGQTVEKGEILFAIDSRIYQMKLDRAEADVSRAEVQLRRQSAALKNTEKLSASNVVSSQEVDLSRAGRDEAIASLRAATASRDLARLELESTKVTAPFRGKVGRPLLSVGSVVAPESTKLATLAATDVTNVVFKISQNAYHDLTRADANGRAALSDAALAIEVWDGRQNRRLRGRLDSVDTQFDPQTGNLECRASLPNPDGFLVPGESVSVTLYTGEKRRAMLAQLGPMPAGSLRGNGRPVLVVDDEGNVEVREVTFGPHVEGAMREIVSGLKKDDWVVPLAWMGPGARKYFPDGLHHGMKIDVERVNAPEPDSTEP